MQPVKAVQQGVQIHFGKVILSKSGVLAVVSNLAGADAVTGFQVIGAQTMGRGFLRGGKDHRGAVHIIGAQPAHRTFAQRVVGHHAEKRAVHTQVGKSQGNVGLAASIAGFKVGSHTDLFIVRRGQAQHDLTNRNKFSRAVVMQEQGVKMFHNIYLSFLAPRAKPGHGPPQGFMSYLLYRIFVPVSTIFTQAALIFCVPFHCCTKRGGTRRQKTSHTHDFLLPGSNCILMSFIV